MNLFEFGSRRCVVGRRRESLYVIERGRIKWIKEQKIQEKGNMCRECLEWKIGIESIQSNLGRGALLHANITEKLTFYKMPLRLHKHCSSHIDGDIDESRIPDKLAFDMMHLGCKLA